MNSSSHTLNQNNVLGHLKILSHHVKNKTNESTNLIFTNRYFAIALILEDNMDNEINVDLKVPPIPPSFFLISLINYVVLCNILNQIMINDGFH